jgi:hypothetical protein
VVEQVVHSEMHSPSPESAENDKQSADMGATVIIISGNGEFLGRWNKNDSVRRRNFQKSPNRS